MEGKTIPTLSPYIRRGLAVDKQTQVTARVSLDPIASPLVPKASG
jgi:hypothetical protein